MSEQSFIVAGYKVSFDPARDPDNVFIDALAKAAEADRTDGRKAGVSALKGALSYALATGIRPNVSGVTINSRGDIPAMFDGKLEIGDGAEG